jgi:hypothetical protein
VPFVSISNQGSPSVERKVSRNPTLLENSSCTYGAVELFERQVGTDSFPSNPIFLVFHFSQLANLITQPQFTNANDSKSSPIKILTPVRFPQECGEAVIRTVFQ